MINARRGNVDEWRRLLNDAVVHGTPEAPIINRKGRHSPRMVDMRIPLANGARAGWVCEHLAWALSGGVFDTRAIASSGVPGTLAVGVLLARLPEMEACVVRSERKKYDRRRIVEGARPESVVYVDDILSSGGSAMRAIKLLNAEGISVDGVLTIVCYDWKTGTARLSSEGVKAFHLVHLQKKNRAPNEPGAAFFEGEFNP
ncbi:MAG: hypothetical protein OXL41_10605 [Nitrospinae bacterium]|nr:hypothetical protein [Nitrospinota bacterium]